VTTGGANTIDSNLVDFRNKYKDFIKTYYIGIFFYCVKTEINYYDSKYYGGYSIQGIIIPGSGGPKVEIGTSCYQYQWYTGKDYYKTHEFADYMYTESFENNTVIINEVDASAPGFPSGGGGGGGGGGTTTKPIYDIQGESQFLENVNVQTFNAVRVFVIIAVIISFIILVKLVVLSILHCLHIHSCSKHLKILRFLHFFLWLLIIVWKIILILLLVIYYEIIHFLIMQVQALSIFAIGFAFWFFWIGFIFALLVWVILHFHYTFLKLSKPDQLQLSTPPNHYEMTHMPRAYPPITIVASAPASSPAASNSFI
jgi:hypothetical protein